MELTEGECDAVVVLGALVALGASLWVVTPMLVEAWDQEGVVHHTVYWVVEGLLGFNIDVAAVFPTGLLAGLILLFVADEYKLIQGLVLGVFGLPSLVLLLQRRSVWQSEVAWATYWPAGVIGLFVGVGVGLLKYRTRTERDLRRFPIAAGLLYAVPALVVIVAFLEVHVFGASPIVWNKQTEQLATQPASIALTADRLARDLLGSAVLIAVLGVFTQYSSNTTIRVVSPEGPSKGVLLGGLFGHAEESDEYSGVAGPIDADEGTEPLRDAKRADSREAVPTDLGPAAFKFRRDRPLSRRKVVRVDTHRPPTESKVEKLEKRANRRGTWYWKAVHYVGRALRLAVPNWLVGGRSEPIRFLDRLDRADVLLLVVPFEEMVDESTDSLEDVDTNWYTEHYDRLCAAYADVPGKRVVVVVTGAERARDVMNDGEAVVLVPDHDDLDDLAEGLGIGACTLLPFDRQFDDDGGSDGADDVLEKL